MANGKDASSCTRDRRRRRRRRRAPLLCPVSTPSPAREPATGLPLGVWSFPCHPVCRRPTDVLWCAATPASEYSLVKPGACPPPAKTLHGARPPPNIRWLSGERVPYPPRRSMARGLPHRRIFAGQAGSASPASQDAPWRAYRRIFAGQAGSASPARQDTPWRAVYAPFAH